MKKIRVLKTNKKSIIAAVAVGIMTALIVSVVCAAVAAWMLSTDKIDVAVMKIFSHATQFVATVAGCVLSLLLTGEKRLINIILTAAGYCAVLVTCSLLLTDKPLTAAGVGLLSVLLGAAASCTFCIRGKTDKRIRKRVYR